jgi:hypothetical protein
MAGGKNALFMRNPSNFIQTHTLMVSPDAHMADQKIPSPVAEIDMNLLNGPLNPPSVMMKNYLKVEGAKEGVSIPAYYLPAIVDNTSTMKIGVGKPYFFTADLSGCLFAAYGPNDSDLTVEHVNVRTPAAAVPIAPRIAAIAGAGHAYCRILSPIPSAQATATYTTGGNVIGVLDPAGGWTFHYRVDGLGVLVL